MRETLLWKKLFMSIQSLEPNLSEEEIASLADEAYEQVEGMHHD